MIAHLGLEFLSFDLQESANAQPQQLGQESFFLKRERSATRRAINIIIATMVYCNIIFKNLFRVLGYNNVAAMLVKYLLIGMRADAPVAVVAKHGEDYLVYHRLELVNKLFGAVGATLNLTKSPFPDTGKFGALE